MNHPVPFDPTSRLARLLAALCVGAVLVASATTAFAAGFEVPENTTKSVARGGTGAVNKRDPSALYFNPALLPRARGVQVLFDVNLVNLDVDFQRNALKHPGNRRNPETTFDPVSNQEGFFPAPFLTASWDLGVDDLTVGAGIFGPSAYGTRCFGQSTDDGCKADTDGGGRYMMIGSQLLEFYASLGAGYQFHLPIGDLSVGVTGMAAYLDTNFDLAIHGYLTDEDQEDPGNDAIFHGKDISDWAFTGTVGLAYEFRGFRLAASYRPPITWNARGTATIDPAPSTGLGSLTEPGLALKTSQAGSLRVGFGMEAGTHPGDEDLPRYDVEFNLVWEDWSKVDYFRITPDGDLSVGGITKDMGTLYQAKGYQDTYSYRMGGSFAVNAWLTGHLGGYYEIGAQPKEYTSLDFVSWDRYAASVGATFNFFDGVDLDVGYMQVFSPDRLVTDGQIYQQVPLSQCKGPDYTGEGCDAGGTPPGNPQNNGTWSSGFQIASVGITYRYD